MVVLEKDSWLRPKPWRTLLCGIYICAMQCSGLSNWTSVFGYIPTIVIIRSPEESLYNSLTSLYHVAFSILEKLPQRRAIACRFKDSYPS